MRSDDNQHRRSSSTTWAKLGFIAAIIAALLPPVPQSAAGRRTRRGSDRSRALRSRISSICCLSSGCRSLDADADVEGKRRARFRVESTGRRHPAARRCFGEVAAERSPDDRDVDLAVGDRVDDPRRRVRLAIVAVDA